MSNSNFRGLMSGLFTGVAIGIGLGMLYTPRSGREIRAGLRKQALEVRSQTEEIGNALMERMDHIGDTVGDCVKNVSLAVKGDGDGKFNVI